MMKAYALPRADPAMAKEIMLTRLATGPAYVGHVPIRGRGTSYRITLQFRRPGDARAFEAEFRYAHH